MNSFTGRVRSSIGHSFRYTAKRKLVKLNITSISTLALHMVHCVDIGDHMHLYLYGDLQCYNHWQYLIFGIIIPTVLLFPVSFGTSLKLLKEGLLSTNMFLVASVIPFYGLWLYAKNKRIGLQQVAQTTEERFCVDEILLMEEILFKMDEETSLRWTTVQLYRNFLVVLSIFILNPIYRTIFFVPVIVIFIVQSIVFQLFTDHQYL